MTHYPTQPARAQERGNILFLILLAVVLFAALAYAVTQSMRGGGKDASGETLSTVAAQMLQYGALVEGTLMRQMLVADIKEHEFDFSGTGCTPTTNASCTKADCRIFTTASWGGVAGSCQTVPGKWTVAGTPLDTTFRVVNVVNIGTSREDVILMYTGLSSSLCKAINAQLNIAVDPDSVQEGWGGSVTNYSGTLTSIPASGSVIGDDQIAFANQKAGCFRHTPTGNYIFYYVVMTR